VSAGIAAKKGHFKNKCPKPAKMLNKSTPQNSSGTANIAVESDSETEYAFMAGELYESDDELPPLLSNIDLDSDDEIGKIISVFYMILFHSMCEDY
jgi:hypothetical protein